MKIQSINNAACFQGKFQVNPLFNKFKEELNPEQKEIYDNIIKTVEKEQDGRIFKFDKISNQKKSDGTEVGIFEQKALINGTYWILLFCSKRSNAKTCFDKLHEMYKNIQTT